MFHTFIFLRSKYMLCAIGNKTSISDIFKKWPGLFWSVFNHSNMAVQYMFQIGCVHRTLKRRKPNRHKNNKIRDVNTRSLCNTYALSVPRLCSTTRWHDTQTSCTNTRFLCSGNNRLIWSYRRVVLPSIAMFPIIREFSDRSIVCIVSFHQKASTDLIVILQTNRPQWWRHEFMWTSAETRRRNCILA